MSGLARVDQIAPAERERLGQLEEVVEMGVRTFVEVGLALQEIRDRRLYRETHRTFEQYLDERWHISRSRGYRIIDAAQVAEVCLQIGDIPANEAQARELVPLRDRPDELREAWGEVLERHPEPTAKNVREVVREKITPGKTPDAPARVSRALDHLEKTLDEHEAELDAVYKRSLAASLRSIADRLDPPPPPTLWGQA